MTELTEITADMLQIDKSNWEPIRFGKVAIQQKKSVDRENTHLSKYVKGEHMGSQDLHLREWGELTDEYLGPAFIRYFEKDDILYGSRRTYLRKVVIAPFEGITSNTTLVIKANEKLIDKRLLPFVMMSEGFTDHSIKNSKGSVNPYINWKDLANYQFLLPPKDQQAKLAELLWAMDEVIEKEMVVLDRLEKTYQILVDNLFTQHHNDWNYKPVSKIGKVNASTLKANTPPDYKFKYLDIASIIEPKVIGELKQIQFSDAPSRARRIVKNNSIVLSMVRPYQQSFAFIEDGTDIIASTGIGIINVVPELNCKFVFHQFFSKRFVRYCEDRMTGTNYPAITPTDIEQFKISIPINKEVVEKESTRLDEMDRNKCFAKSQIASSKALQKSLINQIF